MTNQNTRQANNNSAMIKMYVGIMLVSLIICVQHTYAAQSSVDTSRGDRMLFDYFRAETAKLRDRCLTDIETLEQWKVKREIYRRQLFEMLGLDPLAEKTDLKAVVTGRVDHDEFIVEKIHFQSRPGLYVTANLYIPKNIQQPAPAVLYVCGHAKAKKNAVSYGNKTRYQRHPAWFARNGYVCLIIDSLQWSEIEGIHHGTYRYNRWWWNCLGYTPAGVEAWNCIRALDYLETREEVDKERFGVTGRSGGGAYSWWIAALDERIKAAVPTAGITDLQNHVVQAGPAGPYPDGCVEGHCDCMYLVNTYRWDYPLVAALVAPRALLISNSDKDDIFPLDGIVRLHEKTRHIYHLYDAEEKLGLNITEGPHRDTQPLRVHAFSWFNRFLKDENPPIDKTAVGFFDMEQLKVFDRLPTDHINRRIADSFTTKAPPPSVPSSVEQWKKQRDAWMQALREKSFAGWPGDSEAGPLNVKEAFSSRHSGIHLKAFDFTSQPAVTLRFYVARRAGLEKSEKVVLNILDENQWQWWLSAMCVAFSDELKDQSPPEPDETSFSRIQKTLAETNQAIVYMLPRGIGSTAWNSDEQKRTHIRRRFMLLGQTLDGMRVWDVRRATQALRTIDVIGDAPLSVQAEKNMAGIALYATLFEPDIAELDLTGLSRTHRKGPFFLNVLRFLDIPQTVAMAAERSRICLHEEDSQLWQFPEDVAKKLNWPKGQFQIRTNSNR